MATFYRQTDPRWKDVRIAAGKTMGSHGCYIDVISYMIASYLGCDFQPGTFARWCLDNGMIDKNGNLSWAAISKFTEGKLQYSATESGAKFIMAEVALAAGHFVGFRKSDNTVLDPLDGKRKAAKAYFAKYPVKSWRYIK